MDDESQKSLDELILLLKASTDGDTHDRILTLDEIKALRNMLKEFTENEHLRDSLNEMAREYAKSGDDRTTLAEIIKTYKSVKGFMAVMVAVRNTLLIITPILAAWGVAQGWIVLKTVGG